MLVLLVLALLITAQLYQETPVWRTPRAVATVEAREPIFCHLDVHKARDSVGKCIVAA